MGSHHPFGHLKHKLWPKEGSGVKLAIWLLTTKSRESTQFPCMHVVCNIPQSEVFTQNYKAPKSQKSQVWEFRNSHLGVPRQNAIWMWASWRGTKHNIRGKVVASPKFGRWWVLWVWVCPWLVIARKVFQLCINHLVVGFV